MRQLGTLKRYLKISADDARLYQAMRVRAFRARQQAKTKRIRHTRRRAYRDRSLARGVPPREGPTRGLVPSILGGLAAFIAGGRRKLELSLGGPT